MDKEKIYYRPQDNWGPGKYGTLWAYLNRIFSEFEAMNVIL